MTSLVKKGDKYLAKVRGTSRAVHPVPVLRKAIERCVQLGKPINELQKPQSPPESCQNRGVAGSNYCTCLLRRVRPKYAFRHAHWRTNLTTRKRGVPCPVGMAVLAPRNLSAVFKDVEEQPGCLGCTMCGPLWKDGLDQVQHSNRCIRPTVETPSQLYAMGLADLLKCLDMS